MKYFNSEFIVLMFGFFCAFHEIELLAMDNVELEQVQEDPDQNLVEHYKQLFQGLTEYEHSVEQYPIGWDGEYIYENGPPMGFNGAIALAKALESNTSLKILILHGHGIGECGAIALAKALMVNTNLHTIDLRGNYIGEAGLSAWTRTFKVNDTLIEIKFGGKLRRGSWEELYDSLKINKTLQYIGSWDGLQCISGREELEGKKLKINTWEELGKNTKISKLRELQPSVMIFFAGFFEKGSNLAVLPKEIFVLITRSMLNCTFAQIPLPEPRNYREFLTMSDKVEDPYL